MRSSLSPVAKIALDALVIDSSTSPELLQSVEWCTAMPHALAVYVAPRPECPGLPNRFAVYVAPRPGPHSGEAHLHRRTRVVVGKLAGSIAASLWALALPRRCRCLSPPPCPAPCPNCRAHSTRVVWGASPVPPRAALLFLPSYRPSQIAARACSPTRGHVGRRRGDRVRGRSARWRPFGART